MSGLPESDGHRAVWVIVGLVTAALIGLALYAYVGTLLFAIFLYYATRPLERRLRKRVGVPNVTVTVTILLVVLPMVGVFGYALLLALQELDQIVSASDLGPYQAAIEPYLTLAREGSLRDFGDALGSETGRSATSALRDGLPTVFGQLSSIAGFALGVLVRIFLMLVMLFYLLRDDHRLAAWFVDAVDDPEIVAFLEDVDGDLQTIFVSNLAVVGVATVVGVLTYFLLNLLVPGTVVGSPVLLAVLIGLGTLIPAVGMKIVYLPYGLYLLLDAAVTATPLWQPIAFLVLSFVVVDTVPDFFARSILSARSGVHMGLVLLGYVLGTFAFGWYGLFLGPIVVVVAVHFADQVFPGLVDDLLRGRDAS